MDDTLKGIIIWKLLVGNAMADTWAGHGADLNQVADTKKELNSWIDATAWTVQARIDAVCQALDKDKHPSEPKEQKIKRACMLSLSN